MAEKSESISREEYTETLIDLQNLGVDRLIENDLICSTAWCLAHKGKSQEIYETGIGILLQEGIIFDPEHKHNEQSKDPTLTKQEKQVLQYLLEKPSVKKVTFEETRNAVTSIHQGGIPQGFAVVVENDATTGRRLVMHPKTQYFEHYYYLPDPTIYETPNEVLILDNERTEQTVKQVREFVAEDPHIAKRRTQYLKESGIPLSKKNGEVYIKLYRHIPRDWEESTLAAVFTKRDKTNVSIAKDNIFTLCKMLENETNGEEVEKFMVSQHLAHSTHSFLIPTTTSLDYLKTLHERDNTGKLLEIEVPLKYTLPLQPIIREHQRQTFEQEDEVAIAGKIDANWIRIIEFAK